LQASRSFSCCGSGGRSRLVWQIADPQIAMAVMALSFFGWLLLLTSTFLINHFELFGLHQVVNNVIGRTMPAPHFKTPALYKLVRHPIYLGFIIAFWAAPTMTVGHLLFAAVGGSRHQTVGVIGPSPVVRLAGPGSSTRQRRVGALPPAPLPRGLYFPILPISHHHSRALRPRVRAWCAKHRP
jgi:hypothetical protein